MVLIAVQGCAHGALDDIYAAVAAAEAHQGRKVELLLCCGDFQCLRDDDDFSSLAVPIKFRQLGDFAAYFRGEKTAPVLTLFVGGNHEASNFLQELPYGGWVAPNIFYLGLAGVFVYKGLRIAGLSGIFKRNDYFKGHFERPPYDNSALRSVYHVREHEVEMLKLLQTRPDIMLSHDWPQGIQLHGDYDQLLRRKPFFREEVERNELGSPPGAELLFRLKPRYWFSAHLHAKFAAVVKHASRNPGPEGDGDGEEQPGAEAVTKFLALDKCLPNRDFLQFVDVAPSSGGEGESSDADAGEQDAAADLQYDPAWLAIIRETHAHYPTHQHLSGLKQGAKLERMRQLRNSAQLSRSEDYLHQKMSSGAGHRVGAWPGVQPARQPFENSQTQQLLSLVEPRPDDA